MATETGGEPMAASSAILTDGFSDDTDAEALPVRRGKARSVEEVVQVAKKTNGIVAMMALALKVDRATVYNYIKDHPEVRAAIKDSREELIDIAEGHLVQNVREGKQWAIDKVLRTIGRHRGYGDGDNYNPPMPGMEKLVHVDGEGGGALTVSFVDESGNRKSLAELRADALKAEAA
jgi:hypothetical protein